MHCIFTKLQKVLAFICTFSFPFVGLFFQIKTLFPKFTFFFINPDMSSYIMMFLNIFYFFIPCKNSLLNIILQAKKTAAEKNQIMCHFHILLSEQFDQVFSEITITSLFSNLLDNGLEARRNLSSGSHPSRILELKTDFMGNAFLIHTKQKVYLPERRQKKNRKYYMDMDYQLSKILHRNTMAPVTGKTMETSLFPA